MPKIFRRISAVSLAIGLASVCSPLAAQDVGHYVQGVTGLDSGTLPPPGIYFTYLPYAYFIDSVKGPKGKTLVNGDLTITAHNLFFNVIVPARIKLPLMPTVGTPPTRPVVNTGTGFAPGMATWK